LIEGFAKDAIVNILEHIKEGDTTFRISGTFGQNKTVTINQFGGVTYLHLRRPNGYGGWKNISMTKKEYTDIVRLVDVKQLNAISANFEIQVRFFFKSQNINC
jgi:hypothetical protein